MSELTADWRELMTPRRVMRPSIVRSSEQLDSRCSMHTYHAFTLQPVNKVCPSVAPQTQRQIVALCNVCAHHHSLCHAFSGADIEFDCTNNEFYSVLCDCEILCFDDSAAYSRT